MNDEKLSKKGLSKILLILSIIYLLMQFGICYFNDNKISRFFWIEHKNVKELIDSGLPEKSELTPVIKFISDQHFWILRTLTLLTLLLAIYYKNKNRKIFILFLNIFISVIILLLLCSGIVTWILKICIGKPRPYTNLDVYLPFSLSTKYHSFPSGHTTETFSYIIPYMYFIKKYYAYIILLLYGIPAVFTRVILSYHYLSDVLFGIYITAIIGYLVCFLIEHRQKKCLD